MLCDHCLSGYHTALRGLCNGILREQFNDTEKALLMQIRVATLSSVHLRYTVQVPLAQLPDRTLLRIRNGSLLCLDYGLRQHATESLQFSHQ